MAGLGCRLGSRGLWGGDTVRKKLMNSYLEMKLDSQVLKFLPGYDLRYLTATIMGSSLYF